MDYLHLRNFNQNSTTRGWSISHRQVEYEESQLLSSADYLENRKSDFYQGEDGCIPLHTWQTATFPSCNTMHEIDARPSDDNFIFINCGSNRCTFLIQGDDNSKAVLKTQKYRKSFSDYNFEMARVDGTSMERLTKSKYITSIYGLCGASQITEFSEGGNIHDRIKEARLTKTDPISPSEKLKIGYQIATAVADMHSFESDLVTSLVHLDICCHQFMLIDGVYKLGDFHLSAFTRKDKDTGDICLEHPLTMHPKLRSPEEFYEHDNGGRIPLSNADVFMMGNVMYYVLTNRWLFEGFSNSVAKQKIMNGERSAIPTSIQQSKDRAIQILLKAIEMCWVHEYKKRPTAREVASFIGKGLKEIEGHLDDDVVRLQMPSLPKDHRYTDSDFPCLGIFAAEYGCVHKAYDS